MRMLLLIAAFISAQAAQAAGQHGGAHETHGHGAAMQHQGHAGMEGHASPAGEPGVAAQARRTIEVAMTEFSFRPTPIEVMAGETVRFRVRNHGRIPHEMVVGDLGQLTAHAKSMRGQPDMAHDEPNALTLEPGMAGELVWKFTRPGTFAYACLLPGHYEAGMTGQVIVK